MKLDPTHMADWQIAQAAEATLRPLSDLASDWGLAADEVIPSGRRVGKIDARRVLARLDGSPPGRYIDVAGITPTPLGEGKTTTAIGLIQGLARLGKRASGAIRQASGGPTFNIKGAAAGGGLAQCLPLTESAIRLTGDIDAVTNAHNLAMVALCARLQHEHNYDDATLARRGLRRLDIDPERIELRWVMDFSAQALRHIRIGLGGRMDGLEMDSGFQIAVSSEVMAILAIAQDLADLRRRLGRIVVARDRHGRPVTTADLEVDGAMCAWLVEALQPNLLQTLEGQPLLVHAGPFANIAIGQSSVVADRVGTALSDYHVTESGFGADIGYEKFWNIKCRHSGLTPDAVVLVATIRALKMHGGGPAVKPGLALDEAYLREDLGLVEAGFANLAAHIDIVRRSGVRPVVCLNRFPTDSPVELERVRRLAEQQGALAAVSDHWARGGEGARDLAEAVCQAAEEPSNFTSLYDEDTPLRERIERIAREVYGAAGVTYTRAALEKIRTLDNEPASRAWGTCMVKTHLSLSHDPDLKGRPTGWQLPVRDILVYRGAGLAVPVAGEIKLMPGTGSNPAFRRIDVDPETGRVSGLF